LRISVVGSSGAGKSTLAKALAAALEIPHIELDQINWQPGWRDLNTHEPDEFVRRVREAAAAPAWVSDGNYGRVQPMVRARATDVVWLDYPWALVIGRLVRRSLMRSITKREVWPGTGNRELWRGWLSPDSPLLFTLRHFHDRRRRYEATFASPDVGQLRVHRLRRPREAAALVERMKAAQAET
jgi:energy-coupling factor transporter ATP-binding protein EcfA2